MPMRGAFRNKLSAVANLQAGSQTRKSSERCQKRPPNRYASLGAIVDTLHLSDSEYDPVLPETLDRTRSTSSFLTDGSDSDDIDAVLEPVTAVPEMKPSTLDAVTAMPGASELWTCAAHEEER